MPDLTAPLAVDAVLATLLLRFAIGPTLTYLRWLRWVTNVVDKHGPKDAVSVLYATRPDRYRQQRPARTPNRRSNEKATTD